MIRPLLLALLALAPEAAQAETCRFTGAASHGSIISAQADTTESDGLTTVNVTLNFAIDGWVSDFRYLGQEITTWRGTELQSIAVNQRSISGGSITRQQWDVFTRRGPVFVAMRVQAKRLADFQQRHPGFVRHWSPATFGQPWLADYRHATPERRPDLDLPSANASTPLAFAFYWSRFLPSGGSAATLVLPGFKRNKQAELHLGPATSGDGWRRWSTPLRHPGLEDSPASLAAAWVSNQNYLLQLGFDVHTEWASGQALIRAQGCQGIQVRPG